MKDLILITQQSRGGGEKGVIWWSFKCFVIFYGNPKTIISFLFEPMNLFPMK